MRPTRMMGFFSPCSSTRLICSRILSFLAMVSDSQSANASAQSPPCKRNASPRWAAARRPRNVSISQETTIGGSRETCATIRSSARGSAYTGCCWAGRVCQLALCQEVVSGDRMSLILPRFPRGSGPRGGTFGARRRGAGARGASRAECAPFPKGLYAPRTGSGRRQDRRIDLRIASRIGQLQGSTGRYRRRCGGGGGACPRDARSEEHTSELQSRSDLVCRLLLEKKKNNT